MLPELANICHWELMLQLILALVDIATFLCAAKCIVLKRLNTFELRKV